MATPRLSRLQKRILRWLVADHHRTNGVILSSHEELVKALDEYKGNESEPPDAGNPVDHHWSLAGRQCTPPEADGGRPAEGRRTIKSYH